MPGKNKKLIVANWKLNPTTLKEAKKLFTAIKDSVTRIRGVDLVIAPPVIFLSELSKLYRGKKISFSAQDVFWEKKGSFTGQISPLQLRDVGADFVIVGHSERRALGETNSEISQKTTLALKEGLKVILCIGESERDAHGQYLSFLEKQLKESLEGVSRANLEKTIIAYEPLWAIGKTSKDAIDASELHAISIYIKKVLASKYGQKAGLSTSVIYGGSVERGNAEELSRESEIDGFLVGHASLKAGHFVKIVEIINKK